MHISESLYNQGLTAFGGKCEAPYSGSGNSESSTNKRPKLEASQIPSTIKVNTTKIQTDNSGTQPSLKAGRSAYRNIMGIFPEKICNYIHVSDENKLPEDSTDNKFGYGYSAFNINRDAKMHSGILFRGDGRAPEDTVISRLSI
ncbi:hypothetical protein [Endozoicomonas sp.]|uniref:hypothetical protein n=1 Tax=Endozoicomonas sp. TaxID=1892382 RepID=UPI002883AE3C|nr:hypothetical protein [Endozoicomonas sp.]